MNIEGGWSYKEACDIITELKKSGFEAGITVGGVWVLAEEGNEKVLAIAKKHGGDSSYGETTAMWMTTEK